jgi:hypothetical protein
MATAYSVLGQSAPAAATATTLYTVPATTEAVCSTLAICNTSAVATSFRVAVRPAGATLATEHYTYYDVVIPGNETFAATFGITLATTDVVTVYATLATLTFSLFGSEIT